MDHTPFIAASYGIGVVVLLWTAISPVIKKRAIARDIRRLIQIEERSGDSNA